MLMKKTFLILAIIAGAIMVSCKKDGGDGKIQGHEYVDLGLPSGLKWATCNVGADKPEDYGHYFAWGETSPKNEYTEENSATYGKHMDGISISGRAGYDAATANWCGTWRMPTEEEMDELEYYCNWTRTTQKGVNGYKATGPSGNSIFFPAAGCRIGSSLEYAGSEGYYWSSSVTNWISPVTNTMIVDDRCSWRLYLEDSEWGVCDCSRYAGLSVRPVSE